MDAYSDGEIYRAYKTDISTPIGPYCDKICEDNDGLQLFLYEGQAASPVYKIVFKTPLAYMITREEFRLRMVKTDPPKILSGIYIVENSRYMQWLHDESRQIYETYNIKHFCICAQVEWIDVLCTEEPGIHIL